MVEMERIYSRMVSQSKHPQQRPFNISTSTANNIDKICWDPQLEVHGQTRPCLQREVALESQTATMQQKLEQAA